MIKLYRDEKGLSTIKLLIILIIIIVITLVGYLVYRDNHKANNVTTKSQSANLYIGWKSYMLKYEKLSFMYPANWSVTNESINNPNALAGTDNISLNSKNGFSFVIIDGINSTPPHPLIPNLSSSISFLGKTNYLTFYKAFNVSNNTYSTSSLEGVTLVTNPNGSEALPHDRHVSINPKTTDNGDAGSQMIITMGYDTSKNVLVKNFKSDPEYKNGLLVIQSMHY